MFVLCVSGRKYSPEGKGMLFVLLPVYRLMGDQYHCMNDIGGYEIPFL